MKLIKGILVLLTALISIFSTSFVTSSMPFNNKLNSIEKVSSKFLSSDSVIVQNPEESYEWSNKLQRSFLKSLVKDH